MALLESTSKLGGLHWQPDHDAAGELPWSSAQIVMHVGEFTRFFARHVRRWKAAPTSAVGRIHTNDERLGAVAAANESTAAELAGWLRFGCADLDDAISSLLDSDLDADTVNVKYGVEPLSSFLTRYVIGHKHGHIEQLTLVLHAIRAV